MFETTYPGGPPAGTSTGVPRLLGSPLEVGGVVLRNRIVSPPIERNYCALDGSVTERYIAFEAKGRKARSENPSFRHGAASP